MITKLLIISLTSCAGAMVGLFFSKRLKERADYFESLVNFINNFLSEVRFRKSGIKEIIASFCASNSSKLNINLNDYIKNQNLSSLNLTKTCLKNDEMIEVQKFLLSLGTLDSATQIFELENYKEKFSILAKIAEEKRKAHSSLSIKLGFLFGLAVGILLL